MYAIEENIKEIKGVTFKTYTRALGSENILEVEAGTTGYRDGMDGHNSRAYFRIENIDSSDIMVAPIGFCGLQGFDVWMAGDCELEDMIRALKFITKVLEDGAQEVHD